MLGQHLDDPPYPHAVAVVPARMIADIGGLVADFDVEVLDIGADPHGDAGTVWPGHARTVDNRLGGEQSKWFGIHGFLRLFIRTAVIMKRSIVFIHRRGPAERRTDCGKKNVAVI